MADIIDVDYLKKMPLPVKDAQWDRIDPDFLVEICGAAGDFLEDYLDTKIAATEYSERIPGPNSSVLILNYYPIISLESVTELDEVEGSIAHDLTGFVIHNGAGMIEWKDKIHNYFTKARVYRVEYTAGFDVIPPVLKLATAFQAYEMLQPMLRGSRDMQPVDFVPGTSEKFVELTERYRRKRIG